LIQYEIVSTKAYLETASVYKEEILNFRNELCKKEVEKGKTEAPYFYILPKNQHDKSELVNLVNLLDEHGVAVYELERDVIIENTSYFKGDIIIPLAQPFRAFIKEMMEAQQFPARHYTPNGQLIEPYDITSWSLPLHKGIQSIEIDKNMENFADSYKPVQMPYSLANETYSGFNAVVLSSNYNNSYLAAFTALKNGLKVEQLTINSTIAGNNVPSGSFIIYKGEKFENVEKLITVNPLYIKEPINKNVRQLSLPRIALIESYFHAMDAGWTRYVFDSYNIPFKMIRPGEIENIDFEKDFDVIIIPDEAKSVLIDGKYAAQNEQYFVNYPPEYLKGMGKAGHEKILKFISNGGTVIAWREATELFSGVLSYSLPDKKTEEFEFPVKDISKDIVKSGFACPGSLLKINLKTNHPITYGLPEQIGVFHREGPVFTTWQPFFDVDRRVIATFPEKDILLSGYSENEEKIGNKSSIVWLKKGKGQVVLLSFSPQFRASTPGTYKLLFNSILLPDL